MLYSVLTGFTDRLVEKCTKGHEESISHFRNAEIELLKGIRTFIDEEIRFLDQWLEKRQQTAEE
jgi:hypothetical protein